MVAPPLLELKQISKTFRALKALDQVDFDLRAGEIHALVGENGAGKSTLMRILAGIYIDYEGEYRLDGQPVHFQSPKQALDHGIGMIHQELNVMPELSVAENFFLGRQPLNRLGLVDWNKMMSVARNELSRFGFSSVDVRQPLGRYPLGTQQVVEILRVVNSGARVLVMDEPTSALSPAEVERLMSLVDTLRQDNRAIVYISHFLEEVMRVADRITVLRDGHRVATLNRAETSVNQLIGYILGREVTSSLPPVATIRSENTVLEVRDLSADVFSQISFKIGAGEVLGLYGSVGAGHFDVARAIFGMYRVDGGAITVDGHHFPTNFSSRYAIRHGLAYATESRRKSLLLDDAIYKNVTLPHLSRIGGLFPTTAKELAIAGPPLKLVGVHPPDPLNAAGKLSGGNQQKVAIARWLTFPPKVLIVSEPTRGMDVGAKSEVLSILRNLRNEGLSVLVVSSEPETVLAISDRVMVMSHGKMVAEMANEHLDNDVLMRLI